MSESARNLMRRRRFLLLGIVLAVAVVTGRAFKVQVLDAQEWEARAGDQHARQSILPAARGTIYDRDGIPLAASNEAFRINVAPREVKDRAQVERRLVRITKLPPSTIARVFEGKRKWVVLPGDYQSTVREALDGVPGVYFDRVLRRFYPHGDIAMDIIGTVNAMGSAQSGVELEFDSVLAGKAGVATLRRDSRGRPIPGAMLQAKEPMPGRDIYLTIDYDLQEIATEALKAAVQNTNARGGEMILADPRTGEILASTTVPLAVSQGWRAATAPYEPGSTLKPFTIAALLAQRDAQLTDSVFAENGVWVHDGRTIKDVHAMGWVSVAGALQQSSNIALAKLSSRMEAGTQYEYLRAFGFGSPTAIQYPSESSGFLRRPKQWSRFSQASLAIGYEISVTPLQMVLAYGALANGGVLMEPRLVREVRSPGHPTRVFRPREVRRVIPREIAGDLRKVLVGVVETGTGQAAALGPFAVAGKTGTARNFKAGHYEAGAYTASFAGFFPADDPQLVFIVKLDAPQGVYYGGFAAAPVTRATLEAALAARSTPLDKSAMAVASPPPLPELGDEAKGRSSERATAVHVVRLDRSPNRSSAAAPNRPVPSVIGLPLRDAVRALHSAGYRVQIDGNGTVNALTQLRGNVVHLTAAEVTS